jgi:MFS superfamily sulfate permease-like transporter
MSVSHGARIYAIYIVTSFEADICRQLSLGPEAALSLLIGQMIQDVVYSDPHNLPAHPEIEAAAIALVTTFQVSTVLG